MILKILLNYILGYVNIKVEGFYIERFINICISKKILLWNIKREKASILYANVGIREFKKLKQIAKKTSSQIKINRKKGLPFVLHRYRKRKIFTAFMCISILALFAMSRFIWNIEIVGNNEISKEEILKNLEEEGLKISALKTNINANEIINNIRLKRDDIAWIGISIEGTNAIVEIKETIKAPELLDEDEYCNIVANKSGMITKINVQNGTANVEVGDIIQEGDLLVKGNLEGKYTGTRFVHASASIEAKIWYSKKEKAYYDAQILTATGNTETKYSLSIKNFTINFYKTLSKFENYDTINESKKLMLFSNFYLPIEINKKTNTEYTLEDVTYTEEELVAITSEKIKQELEEQIKEKDNIINTQTNIYKNDGYIEVEVIYEVLENIGVAEKIVF